MNDSEFDPAFKAKRPFPRNGFTSIEAVEFIRVDRPDIPRWTWWATHFTALARLMESCDNGKGQFKGWTWERVPCSYPLLTYWDHRHVDVGQQSAWVGLVNITAPSGEQFLLFSFLNYKGEIGGTYLASTTDTQLLNRFETDLLSRFKVADRIFIDVFGGEDILLTPTSNETVILPKALMEDIDQQVGSFFENSEGYRKFNIPYRRGLLFVGEPGCGKTMMIRRLIRNCHSRFKLTFWALNIKRNTDDDDIALLFRRAAADAPCIIILEDLDSLTHDSQITRSTLLAQLDGLTPREGILVIGTTNNPQDIDPALIHRPSRFDRVWHFELPARNYRRDYLDYAFPGVDGQVLDDIAAKTEGWSFAYLNELRTTAAIWALGKACARVEADALVVAHTRLSSQFKSGKKNHAEPEGKQGFGFDKA